MKTRIPIALLALAMAVTAFAGTPEDDLLEAIRRGDAAAVRKLLDAGVSANAKYRYDRSALSFAADRGNVEIVTLLLERGAAVDAKDTYYEMTPLASAAMKGNADVLKLLLAKAPPAARADALLSALFGGKPGVVSVVLASTKFSPRDLSYALAIAERSNSTDAVAALRAAGAVPPPKAEFKPDAATLARYVGTYRGPDDEATIELADGALVAIMKSAGGRKIPLSAIDARNFEAAAPGLTVEFVVDGERVPALLAASIGKVERFERVAEAK